VHSPEKHLIIVVDNAAMAQPVLVQLLLA